MITNGVEDDNSLKSLLSRVQENMRMIQYETHDLYSDLHGVNRSNYRSPEITSEPTKDYSNRLSVSWQGWRRHADETEKIRDNNETTSGWSRSRRWSDDSPMFISHGQNSRGNVNEMLLQKVNRGSTTFLGDPYDQKWRRNFMSCSRCSQDIYPADLIRVGGKNWHTWCVKCKQCWITLDNPDLIKLFQDDIYCSRCNNNMVTSSAHWIPNFLHHKIQDNSSAKSPVGRKFYDDRHYLNSREESKNNFNFVNRVYMQDQFYENREAILLSTYHDQQQRPMKGILKQHNQPPPPPPPEYLRLRNQFMHPLSQKYLDEIENKSIQYNTDSVDSKRQQTFINLRKPPAHVSGQSVADMKEESGTNPIYESVLGEARETWIEHYGVPVKKQTDKFEEWIATKTSPFVDEQYRVPSYSHQDFPQNDKDELDAAIDPVEKNYLQQQRDLNSSYGEELRDESELNNKRSSGGRPLDSIQNVNNDEMQHIENQHHPSNMKGSESSYSKVQKVMKKNVSFTDSSGKTDAETPKVVEFKVSNKNRFYNSRQMDVSGTSDDSKKVVSLRKGGDGKSADSSLTEEDISKERNENSSEKESVVTKNRKPKEADDNQKLPNQIDNNKEQLNSNDEVSVISSSIPTESAPENPSKDLIQSSDSKTVVTTENPSPNKEITQGILTKSQSDVSVQAHSVRHPQYNVNAHHITNGKQRNSDDSVNRNYHHITNGKQRNSDDSVNRNYHHMTNGKQRNSDDSVNRNYLQRTNGKQRDSDAQIDDFKPKIELLSSNTRYDEMIANRNSRRFSNGGGSISNKESKSFFKKFLRDKNSKKKSYDINKDTKKK